MILKPRYDRPFSDLASDFENIIEHVFGDTNSGASHWSPRANVLESDHSYTIELELPGIDPTEVGIELNDGTLEVTGKKEAAVDVEGVKLLKSERSNGAFSRSFKFSTQLDAENISASFKHGILTVLLPKSEKVVPRKIEVTIAD